MMRIFVLQSRYSLSQMLYAGDGAGFLLFKGYWYGRGAAAQPATRLESGR